MVVHLRTPIWVICAESCFSRPTRLSRYVTNKHCKEQKAVAAATADSTRAEATQAREDTATEPTRVWAEAERKRADLA